MSFCESQASHITPHVLGLTLPGVGEPGDSDCLHLTAITPMPFALGTLPRSLQKTPGLEIIRVCFSLSSRVLQNGMLLLELGFPVSYPHPPLYQGGQQDPWTA